MKKIFLLIISITLYLNLNILPQNIDGSITGRILDKNTSTLIEYANIVLLSVQDSSLITGTVSDPKGIFILDNISFNKYLLEVRFIGFNTLRFNIDISPEKPLLDLGDILIDPVALTINDVVVKGERSPSIISDR